VSIDALIIEDDEGYARILSRIIRDEGFRPTTARSAEEGLELLPDVQPALVLVDIRLPGMDGIQAIGVIGERSPDAVCIVVSGRATVENAVGAMRAGAFDIIQKTTDITEIQLRLRRAVDMANLRRHVQYLQGQGRRLEEIVGESAAVQSMRRRIEEVASAPTSTVLVVGETGTGKELVARAVHRLSERRDSPLVSVNCAAIPENLLESEFFGHERGAFTGADRAKQGLFETAHGGSLFLDEIGELDLRLQAKLLRVVEERLIKRVGGTKETKVDVRLVAATNRDLEQHAREGRFREDLLYRLNVFQIDVPPLRERGEDVLLLARHFMGEFGRQLGKRVAVLAPEAERALMAYGFPGNVRQLRNLIEQAVILARDERLTADLLRGLPDPARAEGSAPPGERRPAPSPAPNAPISDLVDELRERRADVAAFERSVISRAIDEAGGNKTRAAEILGLSRYALQRRLKRLEGDED